MAGRKRTQSGELALMALKKFPNSSKRTIASYLHKEYPTVFSSFERARDMIMKYTIPSRKEETSAHIEHNSNPFDLPDSKGKERQFKSIPKHLDSVLLISDIHFPNHDKEALTCALKYGKDKQVNCIVLGGDILDNEPFTRHDAPPPGKSDVKDWFGMVEDFLDMLIKKFPGVKIYWLEGNHDAWYKRYLMKNAPMLFDDEYYTLPTRLKLRERGIEFLPENVILLAGKLQLSHGHLIIKGIFSPVNPARGVFLKTKSNMIIGHVHQNSYHPERNIKGDIIGCWSVGCLCTLAPDYDPFNTKHGHGFAHITTQKDGSFNVGLKEIYKGKIL